MEWQRRPTYAAEWGDTQAQKCLGVEGIEKRALEWILHLYGECGGTGRHTGLWFRRRGIASSSLVTYPMNKKEVPLL